jgi:membrane protease YdiL (CAAX protease family)
MKSPEAEDHLRVLVLRSEAVAVPLEPSEPRNREAAVLVLLAVMVLLMVLAEDMLFRAFPLPPLPITT